MLQFAELQPNLNMYVLFNYLQYSVLNTHIVDKLNIKSFRKKSLNFDEIQFIEFSFMDHVLVSYLRTLPSSSLWRFSPMTSSESYIILNFILKIMIHFEFFFFNKVWDLGWGPLFFIEILECSRTIFWKHCSFFIEMLLQLCQKSIGCIYVGLFLGSLFCSVYFCVSPTANSPFSCFL